MFDNYGKGDLVQYLESKGYNVSMVDSIEHLRVAAELDHQARAYRASPLVREVAQNAERMIREGGHNQGTNTGPTWLDNNDFF